MRTFEYRLYPNKEQSCLLMACLSESRTIYNGMLETVKAQYEEKETFPSKYELEQYSRDKVNMSLPQRYRCLTLHRGGPINRRWAR